jgi:hypothetical protein
MLGGEVVRVKPTIIGLYIYVAFVPPVTKRVHDAVKCISKARKRHIIPFSQRKLKDQNTPGRCIRLAMPHGISITHHSTFLLSFTPSALLHNVMPSWNLKVGGLAGDAF